MEKHARRALWIAALLVLCASIVLIAMVTAPESSTLIEKAQIAPTVVFPP